MTTAQKGLAAALGRSAGGNVVAIGELSNEELIASLSDEQKIALSASLAPATPPAASASDEGDPNEAEPDGDPDDATCSKCKGPMKDGKCAKCAPDSNASAAATDDRVKAVAAAVASDDACKGKADLALAMLADDDYASLSAAGIVKLLGKTPAIGASASNEASDVLEAIRASNAALGNSNANSAPEAANHGWDAITAEVRERRGPAR